VGSVYQQEKRGGVAGETGGTGWIPRGVLRFSRILDFHSINILSGLYLQSTVENVSS
jgi:hypothetical protein